MGIFDFLKNGEAGVEEKKFEPNDQTLDEQNLISFVRQKVEEVRGSGNRIAHEGIWLTNIAFLIGYNGVFYDTQSRQFRPIQPGARYVRRNRVNVNKILPTVQNRAARLAKNDPRYEIRPNSNDEKDKQAARLGVQALQWFFDVQKIQKKKIDLMMWLQQCGHAYLKVCWDDSLGKPLIDPETQKVLGYEGDIRLDVVSSFEVFVDPLAKTLDEAQWLVQARVRKLDYFRMQYGERGAAVKEEGAWLLSVQYEQRIQSLNSAVPSSTTTTGTLKDAAIEITYYEKRSKNYPNGRQIVIANGVLLEDKELPIGEIPFAKFDDVVVGGKFYSEAIITHLRPLNEYMNENISKRAQWLSKMLAGKYMAAKGAGIQQEALNDQSGEVLQYNAVPGAPPPSPMNIPTIPQYAYTEEEKMQEHLYDISGISEVSRGQIPSAGIPAVGMQLLVEQDETRIGIMTAQHEESWAQVGKFALMYMDKYYISKRTLKFTGKANAVSTKDYQGSDLRGNFDVIVVKGSTIPGSRAVKRTDIMSLYQNGLLGDPNDPQVRERVLGYLEFGDLAGAWEKYIADEAQINKDIELFKRGLPAPVHELDNHDMHIYKKNLYRISEAFDALPPAGQQQLLDNIEEHVAVVAKMSAPPQPSPYDIAAAEGLDPSVVSAENETELAEGSGLETPQDEPLL